MRRGVDLREFEGLVFRTAQMYAARVKMEPDDLAQLLRIKVWQATVRYDPARSRVTIQSYVFTCLTNRIKDLKRDTARDVRRREKHGYSDRDYIDDQSPTFERRHMSTDAEVVFAAAESEGFRWPASVTAEEREVVLLFALDFTQAEVSRIMSLPRSRIKALHQRVQEKMADWQPNRARTRELTYAA